MIYPEGAFTLAEYTKMVYLKFGIKQSNHKLAFNKIVGALTNIVFNKECKEKEINIIDKAFNALNDVHLLKEGNEIRIAVRGLHVASVIYLESDGEVFGFNIRLEDFAGEGALFTLEAILEAFNGPPIMVDIDEKQHVDIYFDPPDGRIRLHNENPWSLPELHNISFMLMRGKKNRRHQR